MRKGEQTRVTILSHALDIASRDGLEGLTIGSLADRACMSKSGVFAHFGSREDLQIAVLKEYETRFVEQVLLPSLKEKRGLPRLRAIFARWLERSVYEAAHGCIYISGAVEYDDRPGAVRDELVTMVQRWQRELTRAIRLALQTGDLRAGTDPDQLCFEMYGVILALHHDGRLLHNPDSLRRARAAFDRLIDSYAAQPRTAPVVDQCAVAL